MEWQPIDTAPKDTGRILVFRQGYTEDMAVCWWSENHQQWIPVQGVGFTKATHWMPLPEPPK